MDTDGDYSLMDLLISASTIYVMFPGRFLDASLCLKVHSLYQDAGQDPLAMRSMFAFGFHGKRPALVLSKNPCVFLPPAHSF